MKRVQSNTLDFSGQNIYVGIFTRPLVKAAVFF